MKKYLPTLLLLASASASVPAAAAIFETEVKGVCVVHAYGRSDIFHSVKVPFSFPEVTSVLRTDFTGEENEYRFGVGTAVVNQKIEMMDANKNLIMKPIRVEITVETTPDLKRKKLSAVLRMYNIFTRRQETLVVREPTRFNREITETFDYFQVGFVSPRAGSASRDEVTGSSAFCDLGNR